MKKIISVTLVYMTIIIILKFPLLFFLLPLAMKE